MLDGISWGSDEACGHAHQNGTLRTPRRLPHFSPKSWVTAIVENVGVIKDNRGLVILGSPRRIEACPARSGWFGGVYPSHKFQPSNWMGVAVSGICVPCPSVLISCVTLSSYFW